jgi:hypothetical protein
MSSSSSSSSSSKLSMLTSPDEPMPSVLGPATPSPLTYESNTSVCNVTIQKKLPTPSPLKFALSSHIPVCSPLRWSVAISCSVSLRYCSGCCVFSRSTLIGQRGFSRKREKSWSRSWFLGIRAMRSNAPFFGFCFVLYKGASEKNKV